MNVDCNINNLICLTNISDHEVIHQSCVLIHGKSKLQLSRGILNVENLSSNHKKSIDWPILNNKFKCLIEFVIGLNKIRFRIAREHVDFMFSFEPIKQNIPLKLCLLLSSDSNLSFDQPNTPMENNLDEAIKKFQFSAKIWQAYLAYQFHIEGLGRRSFDLEYEDFELSKTQLKDELNPRVHLIKSDKKATEICHLNLAQQYNGKDKIETEDSLFDIFIRAIEQSNVIKQPCYVAGLILDSKWDSKFKIVRGHAALGGGTDSFRIGIFGSHWLFAAPKNMNEFNYKLSMPLRLDTKYVSNEGVSDGKHYHLVSVGLSAFLHEVGHCFDLDHTPQGIMGSHFRDFNKNFLLELENRNIEKDTIYSKFSRIDLLKLRMHKCFRLPRDLEYLEGKDDSIPSFLYNNQKVLITNKYGIVLVILMVNDVYQTHFEYLEVPRLRIEYNKKQLLSFKNGKKNIYKGKVSLKAYASNYCSETLNDSMFFSKENDYFLQDIRKEYYKTNYVGYGDPGDLINKTIFFENKDCKIEEIIIYHGDFVDGLELKNNEGNIVHECGGKGGAKHSFRLEVGETIIRIEVKCGYLIDSIKFKTNKKETDWLGGKGGGLKVLEAPLGYKLIGISTLCNNIMFSISALFCE